jgi:cobalt-zinc-cadmium efflux system outer membrane protein
MRIPISTILLATILSFTMGCKSTSVAHRSAKSLHQARSASPKMRTDNVVISNESEPAQTADGGAQEIQTVSAESIDNPNSIAIPHNSENVIPIRSAIELGLSQNPDLIALRQTEGVGAAALDVARTYPFNPWVQVQATPYQRNEQGNTGSIYHYVLLMQQIQLGGQQQFREEAACASLNSIRWNVLQAELQNVVQTERLYFLAVYQLGLYKLAQINAENNRQLLDTLERQQKAGQATAADVAIVRLDARSTRQQQRIAEANLETALLDLKRQLRLPAETNIAVDDNVMSWTWLPADTTQLSSQALSRPDVMAARADTDTARANASLANAARTPDLQIGPYYQRDDFGTNFLGFRAQSEIPILNNGMPLLKQRQAEFCQRAMISQQLAARACLEADAASRRYERARLLKIDSGEPAQESIPVELERLEEQFKANEVDILRVLQARNSLIQNQRANLDALNELLQAAVAVTASSGVPLEVLKSTAETQETVVQ